MWEANAALIVRYVNQHDALVEALEETLEASVGRKWKGKHVNTRSKARAALAATDQRD